MSPIDDVVLSFNPTAQAVLNIVLAVMMLGVALDLRVADFARLVKAPWPVALGLASQFVFLPAATFLFVILVQPIPSIALGLMLVAACPGGNLSNFITQRAGGNVALSVSLTGISTSLALLLTPINLAFWASLYGPTAELLTATRVDPMMVAVTVGMLLLVPLVAGMTINAFLPRLASTLRGPIRFISLFFFAIFIFGALAANFDHFLDHAGTIVLLVFAHNAIALAGGYAIGTIGGLAEIDRRAVTIETGIQNSGLGLIIVLNFFGGLGGMAIIAAWWGIWHLISGFALAEVFRRRGTSAAEVVS
jgi:BASS family bile acid:Na+ symporter